MHECITCLGFAKKFGEFRLSKLANLDHYQAGMTRGINSIVKDIMLPIKLG